MAHARVLPDDVRTARPGRVAALDVARGLFLIASVTLSSVPPPRDGWLAHAAWEGVTAYDLIFPLFVTLSGVGLAFAYKNGAPWWVTARRVVVLLLAGLVYAAVASGSATLSTLRLTGPLQVYAALVLVVALLHKVIRTARGWALATAIAAVGHTGFLWAWAARECDGSLTPECNPSGAVDGALLGVHMYARGELGHDPEGIVAIAGAFVTAAAGVTAGHLVIRYRSAPRLLAWAVTVAAAGVALSFLIEPMKRLWTAPFALLAGGLGVTIVAVAFTLFDARPPRGWELWRGRVASPVVALGRNSLLVYFGSHLALGVLLRERGASVERFAEAVGLGVVDPRVALPLAWLAVWWLLALVLHRWRVYIHA